MDTYTYPVVVSAVNVSGHAKVSDLHQQVLPHQAVPVGHRRVRVVASYSSESFMGSDVKSVILSCLLRIRITQPSWKSANHRAAAVYFIR